MFLYFFNHVRVFLVFLILIELIPYYTCGISLNKSLLFINYNNFEPYRRLIRSKIQLNNQELNPNKYLDKFLKLPENRNLFKNQVSNYTNNESELKNLSKSQTWSEIVYDEILKNKNLESQEDPDPPENIDYEPETKFNVTLKKEPYKYKLTPEGRLKLEDRIENLKRTAHSHPIRYKEQRPNLWIVRSSHGNYCKLMEKDDDRIKSLVTRVRKYFSPSELQILVMKLDVRMPLCEIMFEGTMTDLVRIFYARGGTLQFYVTPRFWTRCELIEKDPRLEAMYGKATSPGLFPQWDEDGMIEEIMDCMDIRPDYALEFRSPNAWHVIPMMPEYDRRIMQAYFDGVHWPTRLKVQKAFESGVEDYRTIIEEEYEALQKQLRVDDGTLESWMTKPDKFD